MKEKTYSQVLDDVARDGVPAGLNLSAQIIARAKKGKKDAMRSRIKLFATATVLVLVLAVVLMNAPVVRAAIQRWFGYIPGFGLLRDNQISQLVEPVSVRQGDFVLTVEQAILNNEKVVVSYRLDGITDQLEDEKHFCLGEAFAPVMRLPDGRNLDLRASGTSHGGGAYTGEITFLSQSTTVEKATLIINCFDYTSLEKVPQNWEVDLHFMAASSAVTVVPVLDAPSTVGPAAALTVKSPAAAATEPADLKDGLELKNVIQTQDGYILSGVIKVVPPEGFSVEIGMGYLEDVSITDANGQVLQVGIAPDDVVNSVLQGEFSEQTYGWVCQVYGEQIQWPLTMTVHSVTARSPQLPQAEFRVDVGLDPQADQVWQLDQDVILGTKTVRIVSLQRVKDFHGLNGYLFTTSYDPTVTFSLDIQGYENQRRGGGGSGSPADDGTMISLLGYMEPIPAGMLTVVVSGYELVRLPGDWQVTWQSPADPGSTVTP